MLMLSTGLEAPPRRSARSNMGKGGQKSQLENIKQIQTESATRISKLEAAVAHEPLNPMAPMAIDTRASSNHMVRKIRFFLSSR
ncbi:hypothetical protein JVT61DRAFT_14433 [Boletus reticuloceps]|uniref:Uncharacterized protein n=1 Tax=Boletus reticuloceps TaxID=495285 RepID=A0A8I2YVI0_9AGAM|nr:hypothetical protein JVT61DRAFT_14433 [Boletus reticuloceps]